MCGFSGLYSRTEFNISYIKKMNDLIEHRGPDGEGYFITDVCNDSFFVGSSTHSANSEETQHSIQSLVEEQRPVRAAIGHRRLSIVDLSENGLQPMVSADKNYIIAFNGEIYNYQEIKNELALAGYKFYSTSDTEVLLNAYLHWDKDVLSKLNGMFAFQIYDTKSNKLFGARDRFGVKPFYYWVKNDTLAVASEIKQFTCLPGWQSILNNERAYDFLKFGQTEHTNETMFAGVYQLQPGHYFELDLNENIDVSPVRWYQLQQAKKKLPLSDATNRFKQLFSKAVKLRLHADVSVGTGLSGGLDSSSIACEINRLLKESKQIELQKTFSACTHVKKYDEKNYIDDVLGKIQATPHFVYPEPPSDFNVIDNIIWHQDEPFGTTSILAEWSVFELANKNGVKVTLDGHGADESLAGYHKFFFVYLGELLLKGKIFSFIKEACALKDKHGYSTSKIIKSIVFYFKNRKAITSSKDDWFKPQVTPFLSNKNFLKLAEESIAQFSTSSVPMQLHWCDRDSMAHSVESRAPFLDVNLVEFILSCPSEFKIKNGVSKFILRESLRDLLPKNVYSRIGKIGFATPEEEWITNDMPDFFLEQLEKSSEITKGILDKEAFDLSKKIINKEVPYNGFAWRVICFANWVKVFNVTVKAHR